METMKLQYIDIMSMSYSFFLKLIKTKDELEQMKKTEYQKQIKNREDSIKMQTAKMEQRRKRTELKEKNNKQR